MTTDTPDTPDPTAPVVASKKEVEDWLLAIPRLAALLPIAAVTRTQQEGPRSVPCSKPPLKIDVMHLLDRRRKGQPDGGMTNVDPEREGVLPYLYGWVEEFAGFTEPTQPAPDVTVENCCKDLLWLIRHQDTDSPRWSAFAAGLKRVNGSLLESVGALIHGVNSPIVCHRCLTGILRRQGQTSTWECAVCGHTVTIQVVTLREAARLTGEKLTTINYWSRMGLFTKLVDGGGKGSYDLGDIRRVIAEKRLNASL